jgi:hypothetical protein
MKRTCANCQAAEWPRYHYCEHCWAMVGKTLGAVAAAAAGAIGTAMGLRLAHWLFP